MTYEAMYTAPASHGEVSLLDAPQDKAPPLSSNARLRALVGASMLPSVVAMTIFNRGMQAASACSETQWKAYLADPASDRFLVLPDSLLLHAIHQFARIGVHHRMD